MVVGLLHPGAMGAAIGNALAAAGHEVLWASEGRSDATRARAAAFADAGTVDELAGRAEAIFSVAPPHAASGIARALAGYAGIYVDANAIAPATAGELFAGSSIETHVVGDASALKVAYAGWTKGSAALLLAMRAYAERTGVWDALAAEWSPALHERLAAAERSAAAKGWRWIGEMEEGAAALAAQGLPPGFHEAAAEVYRGSGR